MNIAFIDFPLINLLIIAQNVSNNGKPKTISGNTITAAVYVFATPNIDIMDKEYPKKFDPVSPINVFAGAKLNGKNPTNAPANAVINKIATIGESFNTKIINSEIADITEIPEDNPSNPSIKLMAFVTPTIQITVMILENISCISMVSKNGNEISSILTPNATATIAATNCPVSFWIGFMVFISSITQVIEITIIPKNIPNSFFPYCSIPK